MFERPITFSHGDGSTSADLLATSPVPLSLDEIAARFTARGPWKKRLPKLVEMLVVLGRAQEQDGKIGAA
ncbi:hypothetical protein [Lysobacter sp. A289]